MEKPKVDLEFEPAQLSFYLIFIYFYFYYKFLVSSVGKTINNVN